MDADYYFVDRRLVHQSLLPWRNVHEPWHRALQITLSNTDALIFTILFTIYVIAGSRLWPVARHLILPADDSSISHDSTNPSQASAVDELYEIEQNQSIKILFGHRSKSSLHAVLKKNPQLRTGLGVAAILIYVVSFVLGLLLMWVLSGLGSNAIVRSAATTACAPFEAVGIDFRMAFTASANYFQSCWLQNSDSSLCNLSPSFFKPEIKIEPVDCPFAEPACLEGYQSWMLTYEMTTESTGLNIPSSGIKLQHQFSYAPIDLSYFIAEMHGLPHLYFHNPHSKVWNNNTSRLIPFFTRCLHSLNGPNRLSNGYSGGRATADACHSSLKMEAEIFPGYHLDNDDDGGMLMHHLLKVENGTVFILGVFHGLTDYESKEEIDDPLFLAERLKVDSYARLYMPDHEANAIAFKEQYRFCMEPNSENKVELCSPWQSNRWSPTKETDSLPGLDPTMAISKRFGDHGFPSDIMAALMSSNSTRWAYFSMFTQSSVEQLLRDHTELPLSKMFQNVRMAPRVDPHNQTENEVMAIFAMTYFKARFGMLQLVQKPMNGSNDCGAMLFSHPDYTNFNFIGVLVVTITFFIVILASCVFEYREVWRSPWFTSLRDTLQRQARSLSRTLFSRRQGSRASADISLESRSSPSQTSVSLNI
jgi:hypothetical protein